MKDKKYHLKIDKGNRVKLDSDTKRMDFVFSQKSMQFIFTNGMILARIDSEIDNLASLYYHFKRTKNMNDFIESVKKDVAIAGYELNNTDITLLKQHYINYIEKITNKNQRVVDALTSE